ncbi:MAG: hypothetical protein ABIE25_06250 [Thermoplasmatota archaeon]|nr:hypothetical protein [Candidatus Thermoplasmatota archaeon]MBU1913721.1 hypothetical protein [Candidatus Thermoplasmatota archaeon]
MPQSKRLRKWFMLQVWRLQQISQVMTLFLLALTQATVLWGFLKYRGGIFNNPYFMIPLMLVIFGTAIWMSSIFWDLRLKMWRYQATVLVERNPYSKEKMAPKEIVLYGMTWLPVMEKLGENDPKMRVQAEALRAWLRKASKAEPNLEADMKEILDFIGADAPDHVIRLQKGETK